MADLEATRQRFEDHCWQHYMAQRERRDLPGDVVDEFPTREQLFWRQPGGAYGVLAFNTAWQGWCWALAQVEAEHEALKKAISDAEPVAWRIKTGHGTHLKESLHKEFIDLKDPTGRPFWTPLYTLEGIRTKP